MKHEVLKYFFVSLFLLFCVIAAILIAAFGITGCTSATQTESPAVVGKWASNLDVNGKTVLLVLDVNQSGRFQDSIVSNAVTLTKESGIWRVAGDLFIQTATQCQDGSPLAPVPCPADPDTTRIRISGDTWTQTGIISGTVTSISFRRL